MVNQLSGLVSGKVKKPLIINGQLLTHNGRLVTVRRDNYSVVFSLIGSGNYESEIEDGEELLKAAADGFNEKYKGVLAGSPTEFTEFYANVDSFTGAVVLKNGLYNRLVDKDVEWHYHDGSRQFKPEIQGLITEFNVESVMNYFETYLYLLNRRLMGSHMSHYIKGHLISGLFQPLIVKTKTIDCPLELGEFDWFHVCLDEGEQRQQWLERVHDTNRGLGLSVISMYDFCQRFDIPLKKQLNRLYFQFIIYLILLSTLDEHAPTKMAQRFVKLYKAIQDGVGDTAGVQEFLARCNIGISHYRSSLVVR